jgi:hypothetical protein
MPRDPAELLNDLRAAGFAVSLRGERIAVGPREKLTPSVVAEIKRLRSQIVELLGGAPLPKPPLRRVELQRYEPQNPHDAFWSDPSKRDAQEDWEARLSASDRFRGL